MATKWGIVSASRIANDFCTALKPLPQEDHKVVAVVSRSHDKAKEFAEKFGIAKAYGDYEALAKDPNVDVAYIASVNSEHYRLIKMMLEHGKHVLSEKPMTTSLKHTKELIELARSKKLFLMEGFWNRFFPVYGKIREELPSLGEVKLVSARFGVSVSDVERVKNPALGGGGMFDVGGYLIQLATLIFGCRPEKVIWEGTFLPSGVDETGCIILRYSGGRFAQLSYNTSCWLLNTAEIMGTNGSFEVSHNFWCPTKIKTPTGVHEFDLPGSELSYIFDNSAGLAYEAEAFRKCLQKGQIECEVVTHEQSIIVAEVMDELKRQIGLPF